MVSKPLKGSKKKRHITGDAFNNRALRLGVGSGNAIGAGEYNVNFLTNNYSKLREMYRCNWVCRKIVDLAPRDMLRSGFDIIGDTEPDKIKLIQKQWQDKKLNEKMFQALSYGRLFGGAIAFVLISGQDMSTPLDLETVTKDQFIGIKVYDRWQIVPSVEVDPIDEEPIYYDVIPIIGTYEGQMELTELQKKAGMGMRVHSSRCIKMIGDELPYIDWINNMRWGASILEGIDDRLTYYNTTSAALTSMVLKAGFRIVKIDGFKEVIANRASDSNRSYSKLEGLMDLMTYTQWLEGATIIDAKDSVEVAGYNFQNLDKIMDLLKEQLCGGTEYTVPVLFQSKKGNKLGDTGQADERVYYDKIDAIRKAKLTSGFNLLLNICYRNEFGVAPPDDFGFEFEPLWQLDDTEKANIANTLATAAATLSNAGIVDKDTLLRELKQSSKTTGIFSNISDEEIEEAENEEPPTGEDLTAAMPKIPPKTDTLTNIKPKIQDKAKFKLIRTVYDLLKAA